MNLTYIISDIDKAVFFEKTAISLRNEGYSLHFILINCKNGALETFLLENNFSVSNLECSKISRSSRAIFKCFQILKQTKTECIHCHLGTANWVGMWAGKLAGIKKRIYTRHSGKPLVDNKKEKIIDWVQNHLATDIVAITNMVAEFLASQGAKKKVTIIHHGFDLSAFESIPQEEISRIKAAYNPNDQHPVIGVVARWLELKGIEYIIEAFQETLKTHPNALLCLFGGSEEQENGVSIMQKLKQLPTHSYKVVAFEKNVFALYSLFDIYVHVPVNETAEAFGQTYVEALASGVPSIFTSSGIAPEFIEDNKNALVVPFKDANAIATAIQLLSEDSELRKSIILNGKQSVKQFSFEKYIERLKTIYDF